jgi:hypothetical protein
MVYKQAWSIKNYRYVLDVSVLHRERRWLGLLFLRRRRHPVRDLLLRVGHHSVVILGIAEEAQLAPRTGLVGGTIPPLRVHVEGGVLLQIHH